jgi:3-(3-hydroxy-phenyl)propionate hydroxylase
VTLPREVDVLVVGYGPVGAALAALLGRYGVRTLVVDKSRDIFAAPRAIALDNEALRILQLVGLPEHTWERVVIPYVRMRCPLVGDFGRVNTTGTLDGHPKLVTFYQPELEAALRRHVTDFSSVQTALGVTLQGFSETAHGVCAELTDELGRTIAVNARYLVGADGASSHVRTLLGQDFHGETYAEDWLVVDALGVPGTLDHVEFLCDPKRPTPHMVAPGGRTRWEFMLMPGETRAQMEDEAQVRALIAPWVGDADVQIERKAVYRFHARCCERFQVGRAFLVGDAAHITPPFVGQGLVAGLRDVANLGWKLAWVLKGQAAPHVLDSYDEERRPHARRMIDLARHMGKLVMTRSRVAALLLHGGMRALRSVPPGRRFFDELGVKPKPVFARGLFVRGRSRVGRGALFAQVEAHAPAGPQLSDQLLGQGFALVGLDAEPALDAPTAARWAALSGRTLSLWRDGAGGAGHQASELPAGYPRGWCVVVRPDRTVLHDGPAHEATRVVEESLALLGAPSEAAALPAARRAG